MVEMPTQPVTSKPGKADSATVGTSGSCGVRCTEVTASASAANVTNVTVIRITLRPIGLMLLDMARHENLVSKPMIDQRRAILRSHGRLLSSNPQISFKAVARSASRG